MAIVINKNGVSDGIIDRPYCTHNRTNAGTPLAALVPLFVGEIVLDTTGGVRYRAHSLLNSGWAVLTNVPSGM